MLTRREQETARSHLKKRGLMGEKRKGQPARLWFRLCPDNILSALSSMAESANLECRNAPNKIGGISHQQMADSAILLSKTETTTETINLGRERARAKVKSSRKTPTKTAPKTFALTKDMITWCAENVPRVNYALEYDKFMDHTFKDVKSDWQATWRNWMRRATEQGDKSATPANSTPPVYAMPGTDKPCSHPKSVAVGMDDDKMTTYVCTYCGERV